ncbi:hypothetical protein C1H76_0471 [Elsinoe australis]|uniref:BTB domain-containing protein n=1 Tax=Elsinoe australis TaxID=40998 RepID=A0A4U7BG61_9PEZI|nr:hypothetical protein C1H76_0471 [Elsinoe australis]
MAQHPDLDDGIQLQFADGDVDVVISAARRFQLHANMLRKASTRFNELLAGNGARLTKATLERGITTRYCVYLDVHGDAWEGPWTLERAAVDSRGNSRSFGFENENARSVPPVHRNLTMLLRAMYGKEIQFELGSISETLDAALGILECAKAVGATSFVTTRIESALLTHGQALYLNISRNPVAWIDLALQLRSRAIMTEAVVHTVGRYNELNSPSLPSGVWKINHLPSEMVPLIQKKLEELTTNIKKLHTFGATYYFDDMKRNAPVGNASTEPISKKNYMEDVFLWMARTMFQQAFTVMLIHELSLSSPDLGYSGCVKLHQNGQAYLDDATVQQFHASGRFPVSKKAGPYINGKVNDIKKVVSDKAKDLMDSKCQLNTTRNPVPWFTCIDVDVLELGFEPLESPGYEFDENDMKGSDELEDEDADEEDDAEEQEGSDEQMQEGSDEQEEEGDGEQGEEETGEVPEVKEEEEDEDSLFVPM